MTVNIRKGEKIGPYTVIEPLNQGGMAQIFKAQAQGSRQFIAIKISLVDDEPANGNSAAAKQFGEVIKNALRKEVDLLAMMNHPGLPRLIQIPLDRAKTQPYMARAQAIEGQPWYYAMEYLSGGSLADMMKAAEPSNGMPTSPGALLPFNLAAAIAANLADTLEYIHARQIAHLDIKPENILFRTPPAAGKPIEPVLVDFGVAARAMQQRPTGGTLVTMAPEYLLKMRNQLPPGTVIDLRLADVYSLGAVTYRMWTGRYPYLLSNGDSLAEKILSQSFPAPRSINPRLPASCDHLMKKWLNRDPGQRPSIEELHCELDRYAGGMTRFPANFTYVQPRHSLIDRLMGK